MTAQPTGEAVQGEEISALSPLHIVSIRVRTVPYH